MNLWRPVISLLLVCVGLPVFAVSAENPAAVGRLLTDNLLAREHMVYPERGLHYAEAVAAVGALWWVGAADDRPRRGRLVYRYSVLLEDKNPLVNREPHVDQAVIGAVPLEIYQLTGETAYRRQGLSFADEQWAELREDGLPTQTRWWIDDMYMVGMLQMQAYRATGDPLYRDRAAQFVKAYVQKLQQENGLFLHGPEAPIFWGRGNGWVAVALAEVLHDLPPEHKDYAVMQSSYQRMMNTLMSLQSDNGMWRQILDNPYAWTESSATAMFAYAMAVGVRKGWLLEETYQPMVDKAWQALVAHLDPKGNLREVGVGTGQRDDPHYYLDRERVKGDFHGQAPMLWLVRERLLSESSNQ
ncbi:MAG TPA: glycoside hydrolase family 88 protein [Cellvibrionaceae bacterium]